MTRIDRIKNEYIRETEQGGRNVDKAREARCSAAGRLGSRMLRRILRTELPGRRIGSPKRMFLGEIRDIKAAAGREGGAENRAKWSRKIRCGDPKREQMKEKRSVYVFGALAKHVHPL